LREESRMKVFEIRVLKRIFRPRSDEVRGECRKLQNKGLNDLYLLPNVVQVIKLRMRWAWHVANMRERRNIYSTWFWWGNLTE
jgi:hypothetical protein